MAGFSLLDEQSKYYKHYLILYEKIKEDNSYSLQKYCNENELKVSKFGEWLRRRGIFISEVKQKLYLERIQLQAQDQGQPSGRASFIQFKPNDGPDGDYNPDLFQGISITFINGLQLSLKQCTLDQPLSLLSEYRPKQSRSHVRTRL